MKTNVSIKFNSIKEYREIEKKLEEMGYNRNIVDLRADNGYVLINKISHKYSVLKNLFKSNNTYNSLKGFLKDE